MILYGDSSQFKRLSSTMQMEKSKEINYVLMCNRIKIFLW